MSTILNKKEMKNAVVFLATGFEEIEALGTIDVLRRGGVRVMMVSITGDRLVIGAHDIPVMADYLFEEADFSCVDALILPGGIPGSNHLNAHAHLKELVKEKTEEGVLIGAICAGPMVLGGLGLLKGKRATCFPFFEPTMVGAIPTDNGVEQDGNIITSKGPGFAALLRFALGTDANILILTEKGKCFGGFFIFSGLPDYRKSIKPEAVQETGLHLCFYWKCKVLIFRVHLTGAKCSYIYIYSSNIQHHMMGCKLLIIN